MRVPIGVQFQPETIVRPREYSREDPVPASGDGWSLSHAADGSQLAVRNDGFWGSAEGRHTHLLRITGEPETFGPDEVEAYPAFSFEPDGAGSWFGFGVISIAGTIYVQVSKTPEIGWSTPFRGAKLLRSDDGGESWSRVARDGSLRRFDGPRDPARYLVSDEEMFFLEEEGQPHVERLAYPFSCFEFVQHGRDNALARDEYVYVMAPEGARAHELLLARAPAARLGDRRAWRYFTGVADGIPRWSPELADRHPVHVFPDRDAEGRDVYGFTSWVPSVTWNPGLGVYVMVTGGTFAGPGMTNSDADYFHKMPHTRSGSLGFWWAAEPWGPWTEFWYEDEWFPDHPRNRVYWPKVSPKWIGESGEDMVIVWGDQMGIIGVDADGEGIVDTTLRQYTWNQMRVRILTDDR